MLKEKQVSAGLGSPPDPFYTNDVESKNSALKEQICSLQQLPAFVQSMKRMFEEQKQEVDKAVIGLGEYQLCQPYQIYGIDTKVWFQKNDKQIQRLLDRFAKADLHATNRSTSSASSSTANHQGSRNPLLLTNLPESIKSSMWAKVQSYMQDESSYTKSPGVSDYSSILVKSTSGSRPHFVQKTGTNVYKCDHDCLMFKSTNGMCSHSLLASSLNDQTEAYVRQYTKKKNKVPVNRPVAFTDRGI